MTKKLGKSEGIIPLIQPSVGKDELKEVEKVLQSGWLAQGPKVKEFEQRLASYLGAKFVVATSSCTTALSLAIESLGLTRDSEVIVPDFTFPATANVVVRGECRAVLADVDERTYGIRPSEVRKGLGKKTGGIMPVHPFGHPYQMDELRELAAKHDFDIIEDAATALGTGYKGTRVGASGRAVCFSFHPRKVLTTAEGGSLVTDDKEVYEKAISMRSHGQQSTREGKIEFGHNGLNYRMSDVHAAIGVAQLRKLAVILEARRKKARLYDELLVSSKLDLQIPIQEEWAYHTYQSYVLVLGRSLPPSDNVIQVMRRKFKVETQVGTYSLSVQPSFRETRSVGKLETSRMLFDRSLTLPLYESLSAEQQAYVVDSLSSAVS